MCVRALLAQFRFFRPEIARLVLTGGKGRTHGCLILRANSGNGSQAHICIVTFGRHECTTSSLRPFFARTNHHFRYISSPFFAFQKGSLGNHTLEGDTIITILASGPVDSPISPSLTPY